MSLKASKFKNPTQEARWPTAVGAVVISVAVCVIFFYIWGGRATNSDYEGKIVDRWADYTQSEQGSRPYLRLLIEGSNGKRFTVKVDPNVYESARVGMKIRSSAGQVVLIDSSGANK